LTSGHTNSCGCLHHPDLTGKRYGRLVVLAWSHKDKRGKSYWQCRCDCGTVTTVVGTSLTSRVTKSCGGAHHLDRTGKRYGRLVVLARSHQDKWRNWHWTCRCDCGTVKTVVGTSLTSGVTKACGCLNAPDRTGKRYGWLVVLARSHQDKGKNWYWTCRCDCGTVTTVKGVHLTSGDTKSCGCFAMATQMTNKSPLSADDIPPVLASAKMIHGKIKKRIADG